MKKVLLLPAFVVALALMTVGFGNTSHAAECLCFKEILAYVKRGFYTRFSYNVDYFESVTVCKAVQVAIKKESPLMKILFFPFNCLRSSVHVNAFPYEQQFLLSD
ncbi:hypothetical protein [Pontibacillus yanchengensis]|uniref:Uncharacterized protein n=1 Tax=Pontibacillus yanchengensis Y32 TaxID=1385514 RepID=A0A0A2THA6_9BACI|nr:hypothetical protein [Pontibacillus yanchengensis]KGP73466.1 hypothetical protein N782_05125 [Pontibacillus yanchengensis Y32]